MDWSCTENWLRNTVFCRPGIGYHGSMRRVLAIACSFSATIGFACNAHGQLPHNSPRLSEQAPVKDLPLPGRWSSLRRNGGKDADRKPLAKNKRLSLVEQGEAALTARDYDKALQIFKYLARIEPDNSAHCTNAAAIYWSIGEN